MKFKYILSGLVCTVAMCAGNSLFAQQKIEAVPDKKIKVLIAKMTIEEKIGMLHANDLFSSAGVKRLGIPPLVSDDGPLGVREDVKVGWVSAGLTTDSATFFPNGSALAATWNPALAYRYGVALAQETRARHKDVILSPAFNIARTPLGGRTYEYYSEDPLLNSKLAVEAVKGIQSKNIAACVKHYALNNQETDRFKVNIEVSNRALHEIYLPAFKAAVQQGEAWAVMSAYNKFRGVFCSENKYLLQDVLKDEWKFKGVVMSDWGGTHSTIQAAQNGLDIEMGTEKPYDQYYFAAPLLDAVKKGQVSQKLIDEKVYRILWLMHHTTMAAKQPAGQINTPEHSKAAYDIASEAIILLKNNQRLLPLNPAKLKQVAVIGDNAVRTFHNGGFGAGVKAKYEVTALQGLKNRLGTGVNVQFVQGYKAAYKTTDSEDKRIAANKPDQKLIDEAVEIARKADVAIVFIGGNREVESEARDRADLKLPFGQDALVSAVTAANPNTIVVTVGGAPYDMVEVDKNAHTILWSWYNGSEGGNALADVILGKLNPSGKMPFTFPRSLDDSPAHALKTYPGTNLSTEYKEDILVGYRWYDTKKIEPLYPFGYGLSYSSFTYLPAHTNKQVYTGADSITVTVNIKNTGKQAGKEIVQLYAGKNTSAIKRAQKELKGFKKVWLNAGETKAVQIKIGVKDLAYFNENKMAWVVEPGSYTLALASSSKDVRQQVEIKVGK